MSTTVQIASNYNQGSKVTYGLGANATFTQRLRAAAAGAPSFLGLWLGNNQNPFNMRLQMWVNDKPAFDHTFSGCHQRYSDWAVPFDLNGFALPVQTGDWLTFAITPSQDIGFSPVLVDSADWPRANLGGYGAVACRFFLDGVQADAVPRLHNVAPLHYPGCSGNVHLSHPALLLFGLGEDSLPVMLNWSGSGWTAAPVPGAAAIVSLAPVIAGDGSIHLFGNGRSDGAPCVAAWMDNRGAWHTGEPIGADGPLSNFTAILDGDRCIRVAGLDSTGQPFVTTYNYWDQNWLSFFPLTAPLAMKTLTAAAAGDSVSLVGIGTDGQIYAASVLQGEMWNPGTALSSGGAQNVSVVAAPDGSGNTWVFAVDANGHASAVARLDARGSWHQSLASLSSSPVNGIAAAADSRGSIQVMALDAQHLPVPLASLGAGAGQWGPPGALQNTVTLPAGSLWLIPGPSDDLVAIATGENDGQPFVAGSFGAAGSLSLQAH